MTMTTPSRAEEVDSLADICRDCRWDQSGLEDCALVRPTDESWSKMEGALREYAALLRARDSNAQAVAWQIKLTQRTNAQWEACTQDCFNESKRTGRYLGLAAGTREFELRALYAAPTALSADERNAGEPT